MSAERIATARRVLAEAEAEHRAATDKVGSIRNKLEWIAAKKAEITSKRINDEGTEADAAEFAALTGDAEVLEKMRAEAEAAAAALTPVEARREHDAAVAEHAKEQKAIEFNALKEKLRELEAVFTKGIGQLCRLGKEAFGHAALADSWIPCEALDRAMRLRVPPEA